MPSTRQGGAFPLSFSKKNADVRELLEEKKKDKVVITDYICDAVRFYEEYKDNIGSNNLDLSKVQDLIDKKLEEFKNNLNLSSEEIKEEIIEEKNDKNLESNIPSNVNIEDD